ncbi:MAG: T9SS type A sorting domain-containing protein [Balneolaceae bacterium]
MRRFKYSFSLLIISIIFNTSNINAQWEKTALPKTLVDTFTLFAKGDSIFAGTERGIYYSGDKGENWKQIKPYGLADPAISSFAINQQYLFVGHRFGIYRYPLPLQNKTNDVVVKGLEGDAKRINALFIKDGYLFAGTNKGLYRSNDNGDNYAAVGDVFNGYAKTVTSIIAIEDTLFVGTFSGIYRSNDNGESWITINKETDKEGEEEGGKVEHVKSLVFQDGYLFAATSSLVYDPTSGGYSPTNGVYRSDNYGENWKRINGKFGPNSNQYGVDILSLAVHGNNIYTGTEYGLFRSSDYGETWEPGIEKVNEKSIYFQALIASDDYLFAGTEGGFYRTSDNGENWEVVDVKRYLIVNALEVKDNYLLAGTDYGVYSSTDNGNNWTSMYEGTGEDSTYVLSLAVWGNDIFAGSKSGIYRSSDDGTTWNKVYEGSYTSSSYIHTLTIWQNYLFAGTKYGVYRSNDHGDTWEDANAGFGQYPVEVTVIKGFDDYLFAGGASTGVYRSIDNGTNWENVEKLSQIGIIPVNDLIKKGNYLFAGTTGSGIYASANNGESWISSSYGIPRYGTGNNLWVYAFAEHDNYLFAGTYVGMYSSTNNGLSWQSQNEGLESEIGNGIRALIKHDGYLFAGTYEIGVIRRPLSEIATSNEVTSAQVPSAFNLKQNYPNPFNPTTNFEFSLAEQSFVSLKVYDITGREVAKVLSENMAVGTYTKSWNAENLASGVYFYRLDAGSFTQTKKLTLIK